MAGWLRLEEILNGEHPMFGFGRKNRKIAILEQDLTDALEDRDKALATVEQMRHVSRRDLDSYNRKCQEIRNRDAKIEDLEAGLAQYKAENQQLRNGAGHLMQSLAACQDLATAFSHRFDMLPQFFGFSEDYARELLKQFDESIDQKRASLAQIENENITLECDADESGILSESVHVDQVLEIIRSKIDEENALPIF
jgi:cell shape-determining protein MreC